MQRVRIILRLLVVLAVGLSLHYVLPQRDIVQVTQTETRRTDFGGFNKWFYAQADSGSTVMENRDVLYIFTDKKNTWLLGLIPRDSISVKVYRNEDTGWIWPPYFKFDSSNLQAEAASLSRRDANSEGGNWAVITHYGWRIPFLSIFPNAVDIRPATGPDERLIPWFNIGFFIFLAFAIAMVRAMWRQFRERSVDPLLDSAGDRLDHAQAEIAETRSGMRRWVNSFRAKDKRR